MRRQYLNINAPSRNASGMEGPSRMPSDSAMELGMYTAKRCGRNFRKTAATVPYTSPAIVNGITPLGKEWMPSDKACTHRRGVMTHPVYFSKTIQLTIAALYHTSAAGAGNEFDCAEKIHITPL